jgi:hypothetical protein
MRSSTTWWAWSSVRAMAPHRRLIVERRIAYIKVGRHVRIAEADLAGFVAAGRIEASA